MKLKYFYGLPLTAIILAVFTVGGFAQMSGTETLDEHSFYAEANLWSSVQRHRNGGEQVYGGRFSYGLKKNLEVGINLSGSDPNDEEYPPEIQPNTKWKFYQNEKDGIEASAGAVAFLPIARREGTKTFVMTYANVSKKAKFGTRLTAGFYALVNHGQDFGSNRGVNLTAEKNLTPKLNFSMQWVSGKNRFGYLTPGISYQINGKNSLFAGYSIGNYDYDNHGPYISFGRYF